MTNRTLIMTYIVLAAGSASLGIAITFAVLFLCQYFGVNIMENVWVLAIPALSSLFLNVLFIELYQRFGRKRQS